ncbi:hypothetical protein CP533_6954 [Ophiocordyceps camponoti-saundersi (nom. inval.)]|nr:hypothetical protein CP533_6954 [Ophiocordyceps camponoti-saundersi (nom. inval.)]
MTQLTSLARRLCQRAEEIDAYTSQHNIEASSGAFTSEEMIQSRRELLELAQEIQVKARDASEYLEHHQIQYQTFACLGWLLRFNIFTHLPQDESGISYADVAASASVPTKRLRSVVRMAMTSGLFRETATGKLSHNTLSLTFAQHDSYRDWANFIVKYSQPSAAALAEATARWGDSEASNQTAYSIAFNTDVSFFESLSKRKGLVDEFARYMRALQLSSGLRHQQLVKGLDWPKLFGEKAHIVDVGGSTGAISAVLAAAYPSFTFVVQDLPETISLGPKALSSQPEEIRSRITFQSHDFFTPQPEDGTRPSAYLLRIILHDWPREKALQILSHLARAIKKNGASIVIMETVLPPPGAGASLLTEASLRVRDMIMMENFNSGERGEEEWDELFAGSEPRLRLLRREQPAGSHLALMIVGLDEE